MRCTNSITGLNSFGHLKMQCSCHIVCCIFCVVGVKWSQKLRIYRYVKCTHACGRCINGDTFVEFTRLVYYGRVFAFSNIRNQNQNQSNKLISPQDASNNYRKCGYNWKYSICFYNIKNVSGCRYHMSIYHRQ